MRIIIILLFLTISIYAKSLKDSIITDVFVSSNGAKFTKIYNVSNFKNKNFKLKFLIDAKVLKNEKFYLRLLMDNVHMTSSSEKYTLKNDFPIYEINKNSPNEIIVTFDYKSGMPLLKMSLYTQNEYKYIMTQEELIFGLAYGIMLCALLYNLAFFYFNRQKSFLYYSCLQFFSIGILLIIGVPIKLVSYLYQYINIFDLCVNLIIIFSILFSINFLSIKKSLPKIYKLLLFILILTYLDLIGIVFTDNTILYNYIPTYLPIAIMISSAFFIVKNGYKPAIFYIIGWMVLFLSIVIVETDYISINEAYILHFAFPIEALIFSFALGLKIKIMELEKQENEKLLIHQSKLASMGEMVANIAHQWRQPLTHLSYVNMNLKAAYDNKKLTPTYFDKKSEEMNTQIEFMSNTIDDFRNFFRTDKRVEKFGILNSIENSHDLLKAALKHYDIEVQILCEKEIFINSYKNEFTQVIFNILNNAKQAFIEKQIDNPKINITIQHTRKEVSILISDNALGINEKILNKVFEPYFTTKENGMGIGLYMSKVIIEKHMKGKLNVKNIPNGALFEISLPIN